MNSILSTKKYFLFFVLAVISFILIPWEWGLMDDTNFYYCIHSAIQTSGFFKGFYSNFLFLYHGDQSWGLFRPSWWAYASSFYLLPPRLAYTLRFLMLFGMILLPLLNLFKERKTLFFLALTFLMANRPLYDGVQFTSLQEFSGCFFVGLGVYFISKNQKNLNVVFAGLFFLLAAWFKAPFIWFLILYAAWVAFRAKKQAIGLGFLTFALLSLLVIIVWARHGSYTARVLLGGLESAKITFFEAIKAEKYFLFVMGAFFILSLREIKLSRIWEFRLWNDKAWLAFIFFLSGGLYFLNLVPWGARGYYFMGPFYLIGLGFVYFLASFDQFAQMNWIKSYKFGFIFLVALLAVFKGLGEAYLGNQAIRRARDWAMTLPQKGLILGTSRSEGAGRFDELMKLRTQGIWENKMVFLDATSEIPLGMTYYICFVVDTCPRGAWEGEMLLKSPRLVISKLKPPN